MKRSSWLIIFIMILFFTSRYYVQKTNEVDNEQRMQQGVMNAQDPNSSFYVGNK
jgi:hypothetical protein